MLKNKSVQTPLDTRQCQQPLKLKTFSDGKISRVTVQYRHKQYSPIFRFYYVNSFFSCHAVVFIIRKKVDVMEIRSASTTF